MSPSRASHVKRGEEAKLSMKKKLPLPEAATEKEPPVDNVSVDTVADAREKHSQAVKKTISRLKMKALQEARHGLYIPLTPRTVEKKWKTKERIRKIIATLKVSPRPFERGGGMAKQWRVRPNAAESQAVKKMREKLHVRKAEMKPFTSKRIIHDILEVCEDEEKVEDPIKASIASKFEYMARELIDKTAYVQAREQHGPWSRTGLPYLCLGAPALNRPATAPLPHLDKLQKDSFAEYPFDFFPIPSNITNMLELAADTAPRSKFARHISRKEAILKAAQTNSTMSRLLTKMGLLHLHDMDYARFPQDQIFLTEELKKIAKKGGTWLEEMREGMMNVVPRALSVVPYTGRTVVGLSGNIERFGDTDSSSTTSDEDPKQFEARQRSQHDKHRDENVSGLQPRKYMSRHESFEPSESGIKEILVEPQPAPAEVVWKPDQSRIFNLKKGNLFQRKSMQYDLSWELTSISDRRTHWRSNAVFSAEICNRMEALLFATKGRRTPSTKHIWEIAEKHHPFKSKEDAPAFESEVQSINRFYERVCRFIDHQKMADPLMDVLVYFLKEIFEKEALTLQAEVLFRLCKRLASLPEDVANTGRMVCIMPILQFIAKELRLTSTEFDQYITESGVDRMQQIPAYIPHQV